MIFWCVLAVPNITCHCAGVTLLPMSVEDGHATRTPPHTGHRQLAVDTEGQPVESQDSW